jgi:hypothetical protein
MMCCENGNEYHNESFGRHNNRCSCAACIFPGQGFLVAESYLL